jgi:hypothetical protein
MICTTSYSSILERSTSVHHLLMTNNYSTSYYCIDFRNMHHISTKLLEDFKGNCSLSLALFTAQKRLKPYLTLLISILFCLLNSIIWMSFFGILMFQNFHMF